MPRYGMVIDTTRCCGCYNFFWHVEMNTVGMTILRTPWHSL